MTEWILWVLVVADGNWRAWEHTYYSKDACEEVKKVITHHRETKIIAECRTKQ